MPHTEQHPTDRVASNCHPDIRLSDEQQPVFGRWLGLINAGD